ncbi:hypothetical protein B0J14DRAFT_156808 [Halenospora varia]|nr:hypothetical protein B0J14DRAFT_156808 [Halenospora varia]
MTKNWKDVRPDFKRLYVTERRPLEEVRSLLKAKHGFEASPRAYKNKIDEYGWRKYKKCSTSALVSTRRSGQASESSHSTTIVASDRTRLRALEELLEQQLSDFKQEQRLLLSIGESASQNPYEQRDSSSQRLRDENIARVRKTIQSLENILLQVARQLNAPTGFESCWKLEPMVLEDAHGTFLTIPLDVVVSWQAFDDVLETHFRLLPGTRKVAKREYTIEDSATCTEFSRDCSWTSHCKPGIKIDMSMVFKDVSKTTATCPKCNTISKEKKGVMVECKNPGCKMLFRTEEDDGTQDRVQQAGRKRARSLISSETMISSAMLAMASSEVEEEQPSLFKRVIMRIRKNVPSLANKRQKTTLSTKSASESLEKIAQGAQSDLAWLFPEDFEINWNDWDDFFKEFGLETNPNPPLWGASNATNSNWSTTSSSWGGISVANFIRDDILTSGTSPSSSQSPSFHSSYLPKLEASFMKDFACCGLNLPTMHDLLRHYEDAHAQQTPQSLRATARARDNPIPIMKKAVAAQAVSTIQQQAYPQQVLLTPTSTTRTHHHESSLSSLGSAGPNSPYSATTSNPHVAGDIYHDFPDYNQSSSKPLTPVHTPLQENFLAPNYDNFYHNTDLGAFTIGHDGLPRQMGDAELMPTLELSHLVRPLMASVASHESPSTPPSYDDKRHKNAYRSSIPKLDRTMTDIYADELYSPSFQITSAPLSNPSAVATLSPQQNDIYSQRLQAANSQYLSTQTPLTIPSQE